MSGVMIKSIRLILLMFFIVLCFTFTRAMAEPDGNETAAKKEVLTSLEQRMQKKISVDFRDTPIDDVIRIIADQADIDIVKSPTVIGAVTATLTNVPLTEVLNNILVAHGYEYVISDNMIRVAPADEIAKKSERLINRIYRITYADVKEVEKSLKKFISARGSLSSNIGTSNIIVTDTETKIKAMDTFIEEIDRMTPQVLVEARIYDITCKDRLDLGIEWQVGKNTTIASAVGSNPTAGKTRGYARGDFAGATGNTESTTGTLRFGWFDNTLDIDVLLKAQQENLNATLLANPRILVLDNETATIKIVQEIAFQELTETAGGGSIGTTEFREVGVELVVTPHVTRDEMIRLNLEPRFSIDTGEVQTGGAGIPQPIIDRREAATTLLVKNGKTIVLGGLRKKDINTQINKIPLLGDLPVVGGLFRFEGDDTVISELVVFITPRIIEDAVLSPTEAKQLEATEFKGPRPAVSRN